MKFKINIFRLVSIIVLVYLTYSYKRVFINYLKYYKGEHFQRYIVYECIASTNPCGGWADRLKG